MTSTVRTALLRSGIAAIAIWAVTAPPAAAHIQVAPAVAAPGDSVQFELLVPGERRAHTIEVALQIPRGVLAFSFEDESRWHRVVERGGDGSVAVVRWHGDLPGDAFARFAFLAATPERDGDLVWKAVQTYSDGKTVAWIGAPESEHPAAVTRITASAPHQNAGGEGPADASDPDARPSGGRSSTASGGEPAPVAAEDSSRDRSDLLAILLGGAGLVLGSVALAVALMRGRRTEPSHADW